MPSDEPQQHSDDNVVEDSTELKAQTLHALPLSIQLRNIFVIEIITKRFPVALQDTLANTTQTNLNMEEIQVDPENFQAQAILAVHVEITDEPRPFEISFKLVGHFTYSQENTVEMVQQFLNFGSLSVMLPFARELLISLCTRLQIPILILQIIQIAP